MINQAPLDCFACFDFISLPFFHLLLFKSQGYFSRFSFIWVVMTARIKTSYVLILSHMLGSTPAQGCVSVTLLDWLRDVWINTNLVLVAIVHDYHLILPLKEFFGLWMTNPNEYNNLGFLFYKISDWKKGKKNIIYKHNIETLMVRILTYQISAFLKLTRFICKHFEPLERA